MCNSATAIDKFPLWADPSLKSITPKMERVTSGLFSNRGEKFLLALSSLVGPGGPQDGKPKSPKKTEFGGLC